MQQWHLQLFQVLWQLLIYIWTITIKYFCMPYFKSQLLYTPLLMRAFVWLELSLFDIFLILYFFDIFFTFFHIFSTFIIHFQIYSLYNFLYWFYIFLTFFWYFFDIFLYFFHITCFTLFAKLSPRTQALAGRREVVNS